MAIEVKSNTRGDDPDVIGAEAVEATRMERLKEKAAPHKAKARSAFAQQKANVTKRLAAHFTASDVTDEELATEVERKRERAARHGERELKKRVALLRAELKSSGTANVDRAEFVAGQLSDAQAELDLARSVAKMTVKEVTGRDLVVARHGKKATRAAVAALGGLACMTTVASDPALVLAALGAGPVGWWWLARPHIDEESDGLVSLVKQPEEPAGPVETPATETSPAFDAPPPPALDEAVLTRALRDAGTISRDATVSVLSAPAWSEDGTATTVFDLPSGVTVTALQKKVEAFAGALGRDVSMIDITKAGTASRASLWMTDADPFAAPRPSPLMMRKGGIDAWKDGVPVAWAKRGNPIALPVKNSNFVIAGMTRSGKGVGASNLAAGSSLDVRINLRIVAGKNNGEWDAYAKAGVASTYFKPNPARLLALLQALLADKDRREADLGKLGKSKLVPEAIERIGGVELLVIDELAAYTRPGKPLRDEILEALIELSAVSTGAGILMVLITQYPEVDVIPQGLAMNCGTRWAMRVDNAIQSNAILGGSASSSGRDASKFDPPLPGLGWLVNPFAGVTDLARSFDLDEDERGEITSLMARAVDLRTAAGRLAGQWDDPIEQRLLNETGHSSAAGGPKRDGVPGRAVHQLTPEQRRQMDAMRSALTAMDDLQRDAAQLSEMAGLIGGTMTAERLGELFRAGGAGGTVKVTIPGQPGRVNGYQRADIESALKFLEGV